MKHLTNFLASLIALAFIIAIGYGLYHGLRYVIGQFDLIDQQTHAILTIGSVTVILSALLISWAIRAVQNRGDKPIHPEKSLVYARYIDAYHGGSEAAFAEKILNDLRRPMALWASDKVLKGYYRLCRQIMDGNTPAQRNRQAIKVLMYIRKDLGHQNMGLSLMDWPQFLHRTAEDKTSQEEGNED